MVKGIENFVGNIDALMHLHAICDTKEFAHKATEFPMDFINEKYAEWDKELEANYAHS